MRLLVTDYMEMCCDILVRITLCHYICSINRFNTTNILVLNGTGALHRKGYLFDLITFEKINVLIESDY